MNALSHLFSERAAQALDRSPFQGGASIAMTTQQSFEQGTGKSAVASPTSHYNAPLASRNTTTDNIGRPFYDGKPASTATLSSGNKSTIGTAADAYLYGKFSNSFANDSFLRAQAAVPTVENSTVPYPLASRYGGDSNRPAASSRTHVAASNSAHADDVHAYTSQKVYARVPYAPHFRTNSPKRWYQEGYDPTEGMPENTEPLTTLLTKSVSSPISPLGKRRAVWEDERVSSTGQPAIRIPVQDTNSISAHLVSLNTFAIDLLTALDEHRGVWASH